MTMEKNYASRQYQILSYDPAWKERFETEVSIIAPIFGSDALRIEHVGSTSVPGMSGKPLIDILILVKSIGSTDQHTEAMERAGYTAKGDLLQKGSRLFIREDGNRNLVNVHVFEENHPHVTEMLTLRDYLRTHPEEVEGYSRLKRDLIAKYPNDYGSYRREKDLYMEELKKRVNS